MTDKIELSERELKDLEDDITFRVTVMTSIKSLEKSLTEHVESSQKFRDILVSLSTQAKFQWIILGCIVLGIIGGSIKILMS